MSMWPKTRETVDNLLDDWELTIITYHVLSIGFPASHDEATNSFWRAVYMAWLDKRRERGEKVGQWQWGYFKERSRQWLDAMEEFHQ